MRLLWTVSVTVCDGGIEAKAAVEAGTVARTSKRSSPITKPAAPPQWQSHRAIGDVTEIIADHETRRTAVVLGAENVRLMVVSRIAGQIRPQLGAREPLRWTCYRWQLCGRPLRERVARLARRSENAAAAAERAAPRRARPNCGQRMPKRRSKHGSQRFSQWVKNRRPDQIAARGEHSASAVSTAPHLVLNRPQADSPITTGLRPFCWPCERFEPVGEYRSPATTMSIGACAVFPYGILADIASGRADHRRRFGRDGVRAPLHSEPRRALLAGDDETHPLSGGRGLCGGVLPVLGGVLRATQSRGSSARELDFAGAAQKSRQHRRHDFPHRQQRPAHPPATSPRPAADTRATTINANNTTALTGDFAATCRRHEITQSTPTTRPRPAAQRLSGQPPAHGHDQRQQHDCSHMRLRRDLPPTRGHPINAPRREHARQRRRRVLLRHPPVRIHLPHRKIRTTRDQPSTAPPSGPTPATTPNGYVPPTT